MSDEKDIKQEDELKPCPFCGKVPKPFELTYSDNGEFYGCEILCCYIHIVSKSMIDLKNRWNKRAGV